MNPEIRRRGCRSNVSGTHVEGVRYSKANIYATRVSELTVSSRIIPNKTDRDIDSISGKVLRNTRKKKKFLCIAYFRINFSFCFYVKYLEYCGKIHYRKHEGLEESDAAFGFGSGVHLFCCGTSWS